MSERALNGSQVQPYVYPYSLQVLQSFSHRFWQNRAKRAVIVQAWSYAYQVATTTVTPHGWFVKFKQPFTWSYPNGNSVGIFLNQDAMMRADTSSFDYFVLAYVGSRPSLRTQINNPNNGGVSIWGDTVLRVDNCGNYACWPGLAAGCSIGTPHVPNGICTRVLPTEQSPGLQYEIYSGQGFDVYQVTPYTQYTVSGGADYYCVTSPQNLECGSWTPYRVHSFFCDKNTQNCKYKLSANWVVAFQNKLQAVELPDTLTVPIAQKVTNRFGVNSPDYFWLVLQSYEYLAKSAQSPNYALFSQLSNALFQQSLTLPSMCFGAPFYYVQECFNNALYLPEAVTTTLYSILFGWDYQVTYPVNGQPQINETFITLPNEVYQGQTLSQGRLLNLFKDAIVFLDFYNTTFYATTEAPSSNIFVVVVKMEPWFAFGSFKLQQIAGNYIQVSCNNVVNATLSPHPSGVVMIARHHSMWSVAAGNSTSLYCVTHSLTGLGILKVSAAWYFHTLSQPTGPILQLSMPLLSTAAAGVFMYPMKEHWVSFLSGLQHVYEPSVFDAGFNSTVALSTPLQAYMQVYTAWFLSILYTRLSERQRLDLGGVLVPYIQALLSFKQSDIDATDVATVSRYNSLALMWGRKYAVVNYNQDPAWYYPLFKGPLGSSAWFSQIQLQDCQSKAHYFSYSGLVPFMDYYYIPKYRSVGCPISSVVPTLLQIYEDPNLMLIIVQCVSGAYDYYMSLGHLAATWKFMSYKLGTYCVLIPKGTVTPGKLGFYNTQSYLAVDAVEVSDDLIPSCAGIVADGTYTPCHRTGCPVRSAHDNFIVCPSNSVYNGWLLKNYHRVAPPSTNVPIQEIPLVLTVPTAELKSYKLEDSVLLQDIEGGIIVDHNTGSIWYPGGTAYDVSFYVSVIIRYAPPKLELPSSLANFTSCLDYVCFGNLQCRNEAQSFCTSMDYFEQVFNKSLSSLTKALQDLHYVLKLVLPETTLELTDQSRRRRALDDFSDTISLVSESFEKYMSPASQAFMANMMWWDDAFDGVSLPQRSGSILSRTSSISSTSSWRSYTSRTPLISNVKTPKTTFNVKLSMPKLPKASTLSSIGSVLSSGLSIVSLGLSVASIIQDRQVTELTQQQIMALENQITILTDYTEKNFKEIQSSLDTLGKQVQDFSQQVSMSLQQLSNGLEQITQRLDKSIYYVTATQQYATYMSSLINQLNELSAAVYKTQDMYVTCVHSLQSGVLSPNCISPAQIFQLYHVAKNLSGECEPIFSEREVSRYYSLPLVTDAMVHNDTYWFSWSIPVTCSKIQGSVFKVTPGYIINKDSLKALQYDLPVYVTTSSAGALVFNEHYCDKYNQVSLCTKSAFDLGHSSYLDLLFSNVTINNSLAFRPEPRPDPCIYLSSRSVYCYYSDQCDQCVISVGNCTNKTVTYQNYSYTLTDAQCSGFDQITISSPVSIGWDYTVIPDKPPLPLHVSYFNVTYNVTIPSGLNWSDLVLDYDFKDKIYEISKNITQLHEQILQVSAWASGLFQRLRDFLYSLLPAWITWLTLGFSLFSILVSSVNIILFFEMNGKVKKN